MSQLRKLIPRTGFLLLLALSCIAVTCAYNLYVLYLLGSKNLLPDESQVGGIYWLCAVMWTVDAILLAIAYGWHRARNFHPLWDPEYLNWLKALPWQGEDRVLLGPVRIVWQDAILLVMPTAIAWFAGILNPIYTLAAFLYAYAIAHTITLTRSGAHIRATLLLALYAASIAFLADPIPFTVLAIVVCGIAIDGIIRELKRLPFEDIAPFQRLVLSGSTQIGTPTIANMTVVKSDGAVSLMKGPSVDRAGWPLAFLAPRAEWRTLSTATIVTCSVLVALYVFSVLHLIWGHHSFTDLNWSDKDVRFAALFLSGAIALGSVARAGIYTTFCAPPISLFGRIATGRLFIPAYDRAWLAPFLAPIVTYALLFLGTFAIGFSPIVIASAIGAGVFTLLIVGPSFEYWVLVSPVKIRISPVSQGNTVFKV